MVDIQFETKDVIDDETSKAILEGLVAYNESKSEKSVPQDLLVTAKDSQGQLVGGLKGMTNRGWLYVSQLWVSESARGNGVGSKLMVLAEEKAMQRGCHASFLDTFSFQARAFYEGLGYTVFGELEDFPRGHKRIFLKKDLS